MISPPAPHRHTKRVLTGQNSNAGMLPPSDSDEDSEDEKVPVKAKQVTVNQVSRPSLYPSDCALHVGFLSHRCAENAASYCWHAAS